MAVPIDSAKDPEGQTAHWLAEECRYADVAMSDRYFPISHEVQDADGGDAAYLPALQITHRPAELCNCADVALSDKYFPASQPVHTEFPVDCE